MQRLNIHAGTRLLVIAPHPDDETLACGELMQAVHAAGGQVELILLTDGERNDWPQRWIERRWRLTAADRQRWAQRRRGELAAALQQLGLRRLRLHALGWPDLGLAALTLDPAGRAWRQLAGLIAASRPNLLLSPAIEDRHPDHGSAHVLTGLALAAQPDCRPQWLVYDLHGAAGRGRAWSLAPQPPRLARKLAALECHASQLRLSGARMRAWARRPEIYRAPDPPARWRPHLPPRGGWWPAASSLWLSAVDPTGVRAWRWDRAPLVGSGDGHYDLKPMEGSGRAGPCYLRLARRRPGCWIFDRWGWWLDETPGRRPAP